jgi:hypothetical protein
MFYGYFATCFFRIPDLLNNVVGSSDYIEPIVGNTTK